MCRFSHTKGIVLEGSEGVVYMQNNHNKPVRIVNVSSKMHELASGIDKDDPHFQMQNSYSSLAAYNRSKLAQVDIIYPLLA